MSGPGCQRVRKVRKRRESAGGERKRDGDGREEGLRKARQGKAKEQGMSRVQHW